MAFIKTTHTNGVSIINTNEVQSIILEPTVSGGVKITIELGIASMTTPLTITDTVLATAVAALAPLIAAIAFVVFTDIDGKTIYMKKSSIAGVMTTNKDTLVSYIYFTFVDVGFPVSYNIARSQASSVINSIHTQLST